MEICSFASQVRQFDEIYQSLMTVDMQEIVETTRCKKPRTYNEYFFFYLLQPPRGCKGMYLFTTISHHHCTALVPKDLSNPQYCRSLIEVVEVGVVVRMEVV